jgi:anti-sigma regulatory factor (Ser/Thr protein kinase)
MLKRLTIRNRLILTVGMPILVLLVVTAIAIPTFQTVKVNGPQYRKIAAAKALEADILPPPAYEIEAHLTARLLIDATSGEDIQAAQDKLTKLELDFVSRHEFWQGTLASNDPARVTMKRAFDAGLKYFALVKSDLLPQSSRLLSDPQIRTRLTSLFVDELAPLYETHRAAIDESVQLSRTQQSALELATADLVRSRFILLGAAGAGALALLVVLGGIVARSISQPISALTESATRSAETELPRLVHAAQNDVEAPISIPRSALSTSADELGSLSRAFDSMQETALRLATEQARVRRNVSDNLVNVGRRNQSLIKRTLASLSKLEQDERDSTKLESLFRLDHLSTRMRRNADSLLVLAGAESPRTWTQPAPMSDVVRAAIAQIEAYDRVDIGRLEPVNVKGQSIADIAHVVAEFLENATYFSPPSTNVTVTGKLRMDGYLLVISDDGVGMTTEELAAANERLANPQAFEAEPAKVLGLIVVGHLANRLGLTVRVVESMTKGVAAQIQIPDSLLEIVPTLESEHGPRPAPQSASPSRPHAPAQPPAQAQAPAQAQPSSQAPTSQSPAALPARQPLTAGSGTAAPVSPLAIVSPVTVASEVAAPVTPVPVSAHLTNQLTSELPTRVRGANMPDGTDNQSMPTETIVRPAVAVKNALGSIQRGVNAGRTETLRNAPNPAQSLSQPSLQPSSQPTSPSDGK